MKCLIIAAGKGTRLSSLGASKPLVPLLGRPLIERVIRTAAASGVREFYVVIGYQSARLRSFLEELSGQMPETLILPLENDAWEQGNGLSVLCARDKFEGKFLLLMSDHLFDGEILAHLQRVPIQPGQVYLALDYGLESNECIDLDDVTRVWVEKDRICEIGKKLSRYNAYDTGIFLCTPILFAAVDAACRRQRRGSLSDGMRVLAAQKKALPFDVEGRLWIDVDDERTLRRAEGLLRSGALRQ